MKQKTCAGMLGTTKPNPLQNKTTKRIYMHEQARAVDPSPTLASPKPVLVLSGGRAGDLSTLKYAFVGVRVGEKAEDVQLELLSRYSMFLAPWERPTLPQIPEDTGGASVLCRSGPCGPFFVFDVTSRHATHIAATYQENVVESLKELVFAECVLF